MKLFKKISALLLAGALVFGMSTTALAADITINNTESGHTYQVYQIFTGTLDTDGKTLTGLQWGSGVTSAGQTALLGGNTIETYADTLTAGGTAKAKELANILVNSGYLTTAYTTMTAGSGTYTASNLVDGYYLVTDTSASGAISAHLISVAGENVTLKPKTGVPTFEKKVMDANDTDDTTTDWQDSADHDIKDDVPYQLTVTLPESGYENFDNYYLSITDDLSEGSTLDKDSIKVYHEDSQGNRVEIPADEYDIKYSSTDPDDFKITIPDLKDSVPGAHGGDKIIVTYTAELNEDAAIGDAGNPSDAELTYQRNPNYTGSIIPGEYGEADKFDDDNDGTANEDEVGRDTDGDGTPDATDDDDDGDGVPDATDPDDDNDGIPDAEENNPGYVLGTTPKDKVIVFTYQLTVAKTDGSNPLTGAEFTLYKKGAGITGATPSVAGYDDYHLVKEITTAGITDFVFTGLDDGEYLLVETKTPAGYNTVEPIKFEITATHEVLSDNPALTGVDVDNGAFAENGISGGITTTVVNEAGTVLPSTGGMGTTIFYVVGGALVIVAGVLLVTKRRMKNK